MSMMRLWGLSKGQLISEWIYEVIVSPKIQTNFGYQSLSSLPEVCTLRKYELFGIFERYLAKLDMDFHAENHND